ncbi:Protein of unknown function (DUF732) [Mycobacterium sp. JS623]|uniref:DUF732 domain-containing protein n=1 Tax=Mycobacterium sp. JS623 TaxID=212767 RepID=UPI0002A58ABD|nr:DUF732 domain-containing protein [Mycobacterium sp. JS623]AGB22192.1 Protein of unknown function (DUF732) [Mycobacterium sp. JS623]
MKGNLSVAAALVGVAATSLASPADAHADAVAYLVNVTVRPGYNFANADQALAYGHGICDKVDLGIGYGQIISDVKTDFDSTDDYQAAYLVNQAANELCPTLIWQLRKSAAGYRGGQP